MSLDVSLRHRYEGFALDADFSAPDGITALFGRSGAGKTTVVEAIAGLLQPDEGRVSAADTVLLDTGRGISLPAHRRRVGYVFQEGRLFPHLTVRQNLAFGRWFAPRGAGAEEIGRVVDILGIGHLLDRRPGRLSGGEKQRVAIGRALLSAPRILLMDEPLAALDEPRKAEILPYLQRLRTETRIPILYVSHSVAEIVHLATTMVAMSRGRVARAGPAAEVLSDPAAVPYIGIAEAGAVLTATVVGHDRADGLSVLAVSGGGGAPPPGGGAGRPAPAGGTDGAGGLRVLAVSGGRLPLPHVEAPVGTALWLRIHAKDVIIATEEPAGLSALNVLPATVSAIHEGEGPGAAVGLVSGEDRLLARVTRRSVRALGLAPGKKCYAIVNSTAVARSDIGGLETG